MSGRARLVLIALCCCTALAACGSSHTRRVRSGAPSLVGFAVCMRSHGVTNFSDPGPAPGPGVAIVPPGVDTAAPAFKRAFAVCNRLLPGLSEHRQPSALATRQLLRYSRCMRSHGVAGFPDPSSTPPEARAGYSIVVRWGGSFLAVPATISVHSPDYRHASAACRFGPIFS